MAGYILYSLDHDAFEKFCKLPSDDQLLELAREACESPDYFGDAKTEILGNASASPTELVPTLRKRLAQDDWFADLSGQAKSQFDLILRRFFSNREHGLGFRCETNEGLYWDVIDIIRTHHQVAPNTMNEKVISQFGTKPLHANLEPEQASGFAAWMPYFSMHLPSDVAKLREEVQAAESAVMNSDNPDAQWEYENELLPVLNSVLNDQRLLFVVVDT